MALSTAARRAIAIRNSIKRREQDTSVVRHANDNGSRSGMSNAMLQACLAASGHDDHAAR